MVVDHVRHTLYQNGVRVSVNYLLSGGFANSWFISFLFHFILYEKLNIYKRVHGYPLTVFSWNLHKMG